MQSLMDLLLKVYGLVSIRKYHAMMSLKVAGTGLMEVRSDGSIGMMASPTMRTGLSTLGKSWIRSGMIIQERVILEEYISYPSVSHLLKGVPSTKRDRNLVQYHPRHHRRHHRFHHRFLQYRMSQQPPCIHHLNLLFLLCHLQCHRYIRQSLASLHMRVRLARLLTVQL